MISDYFSRYAALLEEIRIFNEEQILCHGATPQGVGWNERDAQLTRFEQILKVIEPDDLDDHLVINDVGCGYGALCQYLLKQGVQPDYRGYDISPKSLQMAESISQKLCPNPQTYDLLQNITPAPYTVASGTFGMRFSHSHEFWEQYILDSLDMLNENSTVGFSFNMLTLYSDENRKEENLYYADPCRFFDHCKRNYSRNVALYHDYSLFDFTIVVRKQ